MASEKKRRSETLKNRSSGFARVWSFRDFYVLMIPALVVTILFQYIPMYGLTMAFKNVKLGQGYHGTFVGLQNFKRIFNAGQFWTTVKNTFAINFALLIAMIPLPIIVALLLHNCPIPWIKKFSQTATYLPYLVSVVVVISLLNVFCNGEFGLINILLAKTGHSKISFFGEPGWVIPLYIVSALWQSSGYNAIIYLAALTSIDDSIIEASRIDGATKLKRILYVDLPMIKPTIITMALLNLGRIMTLSSVDKILLLQTPLNMSAAETLGTYVYKTGIVSAQYGFSTAVGLLNSICNLIILFTANWLCKKITKMSMF